MLHTRRSVIQAAAWATPAVIVATAAPAVAASPPGTLTLKTTPYFDGTNGGYGIVVTDAGNRSITPGTLTLTVDLAQGGQYRGYTSDGNWTLNLPYFPPSPVFTYQAGLNPGDSTGYFVVLLGRGPSNVKYYATLTVSAPGFTDATQTVQIQ